MSKYRWVLPDQTSSDLKSQLILNRKISDPKSFFDPKLESKFLVDSKQLKIAVKRVLAAVENKESIYIYGDFDVDGVTATAILWETLDKLGAKVMPYIPHREKEGYGLSESGLKEIAEKGGKLVITVDCGVSAIEQAKLAKDLGLDLIITDHHQRAQSLPECLAILHTYELCGAGVAYELSQALYTAKELPTPKELLDLACIGTVADMVPLLGKNRALVSLGLQQLRQTKRAGLRAIFSEASIDPKVISTFEIGFMIAPRLNAMGRLEHAYDSLRILLTRDPKRAADLAKLLALTNQERQRLTKESLKSAQAVIDEETKKKKLFVLYSEEWQQGIIGLVAGRLTDQFCRPVLIISKGVEDSKGSARSVDGVNIVEAIRTCSDILVNCGGHPAAAGFTIKTNKIEEFKKRLVSWAENGVKDEMLTPILTIDRVLETKDINDSTIDIINSFAPFGMSNTEPIFLTNNLEVVDLKLLGQERQHLKIRVIDKSSESSYSSFEVIGFGMGLRANELRLGSNVDIAYNLTRDTWMGKTKMSLRLRDFRVSEN